VSKTHTLASWTAELSQEPFKVQMQASQVVRATAFLCQRVAQQRAPVDTGFLRSSITVGRIDGGRLRPGDLSAQVGPEANYGYWVEYGNSRGAQPQKYMTPAAEQAGEWFTNQMAKNVGIK
jgi:HK97 gp10 family phage protein